MDANGITAIATVVTGIAVIIVPFIIEYRRRVHLAKQPHSREIRTIVLEHLRNLLIEFYEYVLARRHGLLEKASDPIVAQGIPSAGAVVRFKFRLRIKEPERSVMAILSDHDSSDDRRKKFRDLYVDARDHHYGDFFDKWNRFLDRFHCLGQRSLEMSQRFAKNLEDQIKLPHFDGSTNQCPWVDYSGLSLFLYEWAWCYPPQGGLNVAPYSDKWALNAGCMSAVAVGSKEQMEMCRSIVDRIASSENSAIQPMAAEAKVLLDESTSLTRDLEQLLVSEFLPGNCPHVKVTFY